MDQAVDKLRLVADEVRNQINFGRTHTLRILFDYLVERSLNGEAASEADIATVVLGKTGEESLMNASTRVAVFRLRKKLAGYYEGAGRNLPFKLVLPRGEYRLHLSETPVKRTLLDNFRAQLNFKSIPVLQNSVVRYLTVGAAFLMIGVVGGASLNRNDSFTHEQNEVRAIAPWKSILNSPRPMSIIVGDYYILGEKGADETDAVRLVREFAINSRTDLDDEMAKEPELRGRYIDLNLHYLPSSAAEAIRAVSSILGPVKLDRSASSVVSASDLSPAILKDHDIVYLGLVSGMGLLHPLIFDRSRFKFVGSFDHILDKTTGKHYVSAAPTGGIVPLRNFAYIASLPGPRNNRILVLSGTRDAALQEAATLATSSAVMKQLSAVSPNSYFEALYEVNGLGTQNLTSSLIAVEARSEKAVPLRNM